MKQTLVEVLIYLFHDYMKESQDSPKNLEHALNALEEMDIDVAEIERACLELAEADAKTNISKPELGSIRIYDYEECRKLSRECRGLLLLLEQLGLLSAENREAVIMQIMSSNIDHIDFEEFKWFVLFTILKDERQNDKSSQLEALFSRSEIPEQFH